METRNFSNRNLGSMDFEAKEDGSARISYDEYKALPCRAISIPLSTTPINVGSAS